MVMKSAPVAGRSSQKVRNSGKLLAGAIGGLDRKAARRQAVALAARHGTEIAGAEEGADLVEVVEPVQRILQAEPGKADIARAGASLSPR